MSQGLGGLGFEVPSLGFEGSGLPGFRPEVCQGFGPGA